MNTKLIQITIFCLLVDSYVNSALLVEKRTLFVPLLDELAKVLQNGLEKNFAEASVEVVDCPDLTQEPFILANRGLAGNNTKIVDIGGIPYLLPLPSKDKIYETKEIAKLINTQNGFIIGAGAGPHPYVGVNSEGMINLNIVNGTIDQQSRISKVDVVTGNPIQELLPQTETRFSLMANLFVSEGNPGKVLKVFAKGRTGANDFVTSLRQALVDNYKNRLIGLGGVFLIKEGKVKQHVMPNFSTTPLENDAQLNNWLKFYNMSAPLIALGTLVNGDANLDLRVQHFHSFSHHGEGGHYHNDVTPDIVEYLGYFNVGDELYRIDRPPHISSIVL